MTTSKRFFTTKYRSSLQWAAQFTGTGLLLSALVSGCKTTPPVVQQAAPPKPVIITLGKKDFSTDDFFQSFTKNQAMADSNQRTDLKDYLTLYTNLKLKVVAAEDQGRDTTEAFREELDTYRKQLAQTYMTDKVMIENMAAEAYQRIQQEVNVSHILIPVSEDAAPADTLAAYDQAIAIRKRILAGEDFAALAKQYSKDQLSADKGGSLGYNIAFQLTYPLETAAYQTTVGGVSQPVRSRFGYHLVRPAERRASRGKVHVAHILVRISPNVDKAGEEGAYNRATEIYQRLQNGESFDAVCRELSDDASTRNTGGMLTWLEPGRWVPAFEEAAYSLTTPGQYTKPIRTNYGWHIIKLLERKPLESYQELAPALRQKVVTDTRAEVLRQITVQRLRKEYKIDENRSVVTAALAKADSSLLAGKWKLTTPLEPALEGKNLFTANQKPATVNAFFAYVQQKQQPARKIVNGPGAVPAVAMQRYYKRFQDDKLMEAEDANLEKKYPELRALMTEIRDGVLLSQMMEDNVWEKSMTDTLGQRQLYERNKDKYRYPERAVATIIVAANNEVLNQASDMMKQLPYQLRRSSGPMVYEKNQTGMTASLKERLFDVLVALSRNPNYIVEITGSHSPSEADSVSANRLRTVISYLRYNGIPLTRIVEKDEKGFRAGAKTDAEHQRVTFQYFTTAKEDVARVLNTKPGQTGPASITITEGIYAKGAEPLLDGIAWQPDTTTRTVNGKTVQVIISRIEPSRLKTLDEARGTVINEYQALLEKQWLETLRAKYPVKINEDELRKLVK